MDITKITAALATARAEANNLTTAARKVFADPKADVEALNAASKTMRVAGKIDSALKTAEARVAKATKVREKKAKGKKADAAAPAAKK